MKHTCIIRARIYLTQPAAKAKYINQVKEANSTILKSIEKKLHFSFSLMQIVLKKILEYDSCKNYLHIQSLGSTNKKDVTKHIQRESTKTVQWL